MQNVVKKARNLRIHWNETHLNEDLFLFLTENYSIEIVEMNLRNNINGISWYVMDQHIITINSKLSGFERLLTMWHEFGHYLMHFPNKTVGSYFWGDEKIYKGNRKQENEADAFAYCAVIPLIWLKEKTFTDLLDEGFTDEQIWKRKEIYERYKI